MFPKIPICLAKCLFTNIYICSAIIVCEEQVRKKSLCLSSIIYFTKITVYQNIHLLKYLFTKYLFVLRIQCKRGLDYTINCFGCFSLLLHVFDNFIFGYNKKYTDQFFLFFTCLLLSVMEIKHQPTPGQIFWTEVPSGMRRPQSEEEGSTMSETYSTLQSASAEYRISSPLGCPPAKV